MIIAVPLHPNKLKQRGFNQVNELLRDLEYKYPQLQRGTALRIKDTKSQALLGREQRQYNLRGAFRLTSQVRGKRIAIVDDVVTSCATVNALANECHKQGALSVEVWCFLRKQA